MRIWLLSLTIGFLPLAAAAQDSRVQLHLNTDEAEAALAVLDARAAHGSVPESLWKRLGTTEGFTRLAARERSFGRGLTLDSMRAFLSQDSVVARRGQWRRTLESWRTLPVQDPGARALAYLPAGTPLVATVYLLIKPRTNSFVWELQTRPAIMLYLDPEVRPPQFANTVAHELHHIGLSAACSSQADTLFADTSSAAVAARTWLSAFGEGLAMLAAAGGPEVHPHRDSPAADRDRWDRDMRDASRQMRDVEDFFVRLLDGRLTGDSVAAEAMQFFGVQGPWYTVGYRMWREVELRFGHGRVILDACDRVRLLLDYQRAVADDPRLPRWSDAFAARLEKLGRRRL